MPATRGDRRRRPGRSRSSRAWRRRRSATWPPRWARRAGSSTTTSTRWTTCWPRRSSGSRGRTWPSPRRRWPRAPGPREALVEFFADVHPGRQGLGVPALARRLGRGGPPAGAAGDLAPAEPGLAGAARADDPGGRRRRLVPLRRPVRRRVADPVAARRAGAPGRRPRDDRRAAPTSSWTTAAAEARAGAGAGSARLVAAAAMSEPSPRPPPRQVRLVLVDRAGTVLGVLPVVRGGGPVVAGGRAGRRRRARALRGRRRRSCASLEVE